MLYQVHLAMSRAWTDNISGDRRWLYQVVTNQTTIHSSADQWFSLGTPVSSTNKTDLHDITEILMEGKCH
jgi:hypothetical protein